MKELYKRHRPKSLDRIVGQKEAVTTLQNLFNTKSVPHAILLSGNSGCGKTTLARIIAKNLGCHPTDTTEINCSDFRGIDTIRDIRSTIGQNPLCGPCRVWIIDEAHQMVSGAQDAFLKLLEDTPDHAYFILATTNPNKLLATVRNRCTSIKVTPLSTDEMEDLISYVCKKEKKKLDEEVKDRIIEVAEGSARFALVLLHSVIDIKKKQEQLNAIQNADIKRQSIELARLMIKPGVNWKEVANVIKTLDEEPEQLRRMILGYAASIMLNGGNLVPKCAVIIDYFENNFFDSGKAGLVLACYNVVLAGKRK